MTERERRKKRPGVKGEGGEGKGDAVRREVGDGDERG